ncbi:MAG: DUF1540 domain-containing protein [Oscillospiraceae bacterium]|jgi:hypothetical protein|nr:DUF1540 domain-containing protein [Oscillospiraceae bacterium]
MDNYNNQKPSNPSIRCSVDCCKYHCGTQNYCSLNSVTIGTHEQEPTHSEAVDCQDFSRSQNLG